MIKLLHRFTKWLEHSICGKTPEVVKQIRYQGFVSKEDLVQLGSLDRRVTLGWQELAKASRTQSRYLYL